MTNIIWIVENEDLGNAGIEIRLRPIIKRLEDSSVYVKIQTYRDLHIQLLSNAKIDKDLFFILSKPHKPEYLSYMLALHARGCLVGIDIFDNYYAPSLALRHLGVQSVWNNALANADFCTFSTHFLARYASGVSVNDKPSFIVSDPIECSHVSITNKLDKKKWTQLSLLKHEVRVTWFGIDANPYFEVGLADIYRNIPRLIEIKDAITKSMGSQTIMNFSICTRKTKHIEPLLSALWELGIPTHFIEWSKLACAELISNTHIVYLPTNNGIFSLSKTHNRLVDSIANNCISYISPNGLYTWLKGDLCIDSQSDLIHLLEKFKTDADIEILRETTMDRIACMINEEDQLPDFISYLKSNPSKSMQHKGKFALIGSVPNADIIKILRKANVPMAGIVSTLVKSPPSYDDVTLFHDTRGLRIRVKKNTIMRITSDKQHDLFSGNATHILRTTKNSRVQFLHFDGDDPMFVEVSIRSHGTPLCDLSANHELLQHDKNLVFRNPYLLKMVIALYECLYVYCSSVLGINDISVISGSNSIGYHLDSLIGGDCVKR